MATKKTQGAAGVLTAGKKGNTKNMKVKATSNADLLDGYMRLEVACAFYNKKVAKAWDNLKGQGKDPFKYEEFNRTFKTAKKIEKAKRFCDFAITLAYNSVCDLAIYE